MSSSTRPPGRRSGRSIAVATLLGLLAALAVACGDGGDSGEAADATTTTAAATATTSPYGDAPPVDPPGPDDVVLTVVGPAGTQTYTLATLRERATTEVTVDEPFVKRRETFGGVPLAELFAEAGIPDTAEVNTVALNDYEFAAPAEVFAGSGGLLAVTQAGGDIPIAAGGPIRIVFPDGSPSATNLDAWNWSLERIEAR